MSVRQRRPQFREADLEPQAVAQALHELGYRLSEPGRRNGWHARWADVGVVAVEHPEHRHPAVLATLAERLADARPWAVAPAAGHLRVSRDWLAELRRAYAELEPGAEDIARHKAAFRELCARYDTDPAFRARVDAACRDLEDETD